MAQEEFDDAIVGAGVIGVPIKKFVLTKFSLLRLGFLWLSTCLMKSLSTFWDKRNSLPADFTSPGF